jgi:iron complex transport system ATP-binding protein
VGIQVEKLTAGYGEEPVLKDITLVVRKGCLCGLIGQNGSGKTTLMRCINAILKPHRGRVIVSGKEISNLSRDKIARLISVVPQGSFSPFPFSSLDMILMGGAARIRSWQSPGIDEKDRARQVCEDVGITAFVSTPFNHLSGGQKQLVMLARALYQDAPIMLLDEPNSHLDFCNQHRMMGLVHEIVKSNNKTALITLHDPNLALHYCDEVVMMKEGIVAISGATEDVINGDYLEITLGENVKRDTTMSGLMVVVPKNVPAQI